MATSTTNLGLIKPSGSDKIRIAQINGNMDIIDDKVGAVGNTSLQTQTNTLYDAVGVVINGKQATTSASTGQYVILKNSSISGRVDGLYTAANAIPSSTNLDSSYLTAVSKGGLNSVSERIATLETNYLPCMDIGSVSSSSSITLTIGGTVRFILITTSSGATRAGMWLCHGGTGNCYAFPMTSSATNITVTAGSSGTYTITNSTTSGAAVFIILMSGAVSDITKS